MEAHWGAGTSGEALRAQVTDNDNKIDTDNYE